MKIQFVGPQKHSWELDILPNILILRTKRDIRFALSIFLWGIVFVFKVK